jgi:hypothetical protein
LIPGGKRDETNVSGVWYFQVHFKIIYIKILDTIIILIERNIYEIIFIIYYNMSRIIENNPTPYDLRDFEDDISIYGKAASIDKLYLETSLREDGSLPLSRCSSVSNLWFAVVFLKCNYSDEILENAARDLLRVSDREFRASVCRRFLDALTCEPDVIERIRTILP